MRSSALPSQSPVFAPYHRSAPYSAIQDDGKIRAHIAENRPLGRVRRSFVVEGRIAERAKYIHIIYGGGREEVSIARLPAAGIPTAAPRRRGAGVGGGRISRRDNWGTPVASGEPMGIPAADGEERDDDLRSTAYVRRSFFRFFFSPSVFVFWKHRGGRRRRGVAAAGRGPPGE